MTNKCERQNNEDGHNFVDEVPEQPFTLLYR